jgi:hypothetical protein
VSVIDVLTYTHGSVTMPELAWSIVASMGLIVSLLSIIDAQRNLFYLHAAPRDGSVYDAAVRETLAKSHLHNELYRIGMHGVSVVIGIVAMDTAPANAATPVTPLGYVIALGLITKAALNVAASIKDRHVRSRMIDLLVEQERLRDAEAGALHS